MFDPVPFLIDGNILDPVIRAEIHDLYFIQKFFVQKSRQISLRRRSEDHIHAGSKLFEIIIHTSIVHKFKKIAVDGRVFFIYVASGAVPYNLRIFMSHEKSHQLGAGVSGRSDNTSLDHFFCSFPFFYH